MFYKYVKCALFVMLLGLSCCAGQHAAAFPDLTETLPTAEIPDGTVTIKMDFWTKEKKYVLLPMLKSASVVMAFEYQDQNPSRDTSRHFQLRKDLAVTDIRTDVAIDGAGFTMGLKSWKNPKVKIYPGPEGTGDLGFYTLEITFSDNAKNADSKLGIVVFLVRLTRDHVVHIWQIPGSLLWRGAAALEYRASVHVAPTSIERHQ